MRFLFISIGVFIIGLAICGLAVAFSLALLIVSPIAGIVALVIMLRRGVVRKDGRTGVKGPGGFSFFTKVVSSLKSSEVNGGQV